MKKPRLYLIVCFLTIALLTTFCFAQEEEGTMEEPEHVVKVLRTTNKAQVNKYVPRVYTFNNVNPHEIVIYFTNALKTEEGGAYTFVNPEGTGGKILVICPEYQIPHFDKLAKNLDRKDITSAPGSKYVYYRLKHRSAGDLGMLNVLSNYGGELPVITPHPGRPGQALQADFETNSILLFDAPSGTENAQEFLEQELDVPTPQVELQLKIYEVDTDNNGVIGLDYIDWKNGPGAILASGYARGERFDGELSSGDAYYNDRAYGGGYYLDYPSAYFDFLVVKNKARIVKQTTLTALTNNPASIERNEQYLYFSKQYPGEPAGPILTNPGSNQEAMPIETSDIDAVPRWNRQVDLDVAPMEVSTQLEVFPRIGSEHVDLSIDFIVESVTGYADGRVGDAMVRDMPIVNVRAFSDQINVPIGKEVVISGLVSERELKNTQKMPILGSLPVIGWLFGGENSRTDKKMMVAVIKPVSIDDTNFDAEREMIASKATGESPISVPATKVGFDQWLLDTEK